MENTPSNGPKFSTYEDNGLPECKKLVEAATNELINLVARLDSLPLDPDDLDYRFEGYAHSSFEVDISLMNRMMELPYPEVPTCPTIEEMVKFRNILIEEVNEINQIIDKLEDLKKMPTTTPEDLQVRENFEVEILADVADVCCDVPVYCVSQMGKHGLHFGACMFHVMNSNFTKLHNGKRVWNEELGKFEKGPNYIPPEPAIRESIREVLLMAKEEEVK